MDSRMTGVLSALFDEKNIDAMISISEKALRVYPDDLTLRYTAGIAHICRGAVGEGLSRLQDTILRYAAQIAGKPYDPAAAVFIARVAQQICQVSAFYGVRSMRHLSAYSEQSAQVLLLLSAQLRDSALQEFAQGVLACHHRWKKSADVPGAEGMCFIPPSPYLVQIEPTNYCNLACTMCPHQQMSRPKGYLDEGTLERMLSTWSYRRRKLSFPHLALPGKMICDESCGAVKLYFMGEPLLHPAFEQLIKRLRKEGVGVGVQTNGFLLSDPLVRRRLLGAGPSEISFSIDGYSPDVYDAIRKGSRWPVIKDVLRHMHEDRGRMGLYESVRIGVSSIIPDTSDETKKRAELFFRSVQDYVDGIAFIVLNKQCAGEFYDATGSIFSYSASGEADSDASVPLCSEPLERMNVLWNGDLIPCCYDYDARMTLGNVEDGIDAVWQGSRMRELRRALLSGDPQAFPLCMECKKR
jgi:pyruvate-formate lyase-activating enzyme